MANAQFTPQTYAPLFCAINGEAQSWVKEISVDFDSNAQDVETIMRQWSGVAQGASRVDFTLHQVVPYQPTDTSGTGLGALGNTAAGTDLISTMITTINQNGNTPITLKLGIGGFNPVSNTQFLSGGFIKKASLSYSTSGVMMIVYTGTLSFADFR
jgi:hypothetical protein